MGNRQHQENKHYSGSSREPAGKHYLAASWELAVIPSMLGEIESLEEAKMK
jgi:hypothetical protein